MILKFNIAESDLRAYQAHSGTSLHERKPFQQPLLWGAPLIGLGAFLLCRNWLPQQTILVPAGIAALLMAIWVVWTRSDGGSRGKTRRLEAMLGDGEVEIVPKGLRITTAAGEQTVFWDTVGQVATTPTHTFIYYGKEQCLIIPQRRVRDGNYPAFLEAVAEVLRYNPSRSRGRM